MAEMTPVTAKPEDTHPGAAALPLVDVLETDEELVLVVDLPGVQPSDVDIRFENGELTLHGRRAFQHSGHKPLTHGAEIASYHRTFRVTEKVDASRIHADLKHGVLTMHLPKLEAVKPRRISVRGE